MDEWIKETCYVCTREHYKIGNLTTCHNMDDLEAVMLSETRQRKTNTAPYNLTHLWTGTHTSAQTHRTRWWVPQAEGGAGKWVERQKVQISGCQVTKSQKGDAQHGDCD